MNKTFYDKCRAKGHVLALDEDGSVKYFDGDYHGGPECVECGASWCEHCYDPVSQCEGSGPRLAREAKYAEERARTAAAIAAWDDPILLRDRIAELMERAP